MIGTARAALPAAHQPSSTGLEAAKRAATLGDPDAWDWFYAQDVVVAACRAAFAGSRS